MVKDPRIKNGILYLTPYYDEVLYSEISSSLVEFLDKEQHRQAEFRNGKISVSTISSCPVKAYNLLFNDVIIKEKKLSKLFSQAVIGTAIHEFMEKILKKEEKYIIEKGYSFTKDNITFRGSIDLEFDNCIVDFKSGQYEKLKNIKYPLTYSKQLIFYGILKTYPDVEKALSYDYYNIFILKDGTGKSKPSLAFYKIPYFLVLQLYSYCLKQIDLICNSYNRKINNQWCPVPPEEFVLPNLIREHKKMRVPHINDVTAYECFFCDFYDCKSKYVIDYEIEDC